jgi:hypothetical protein
MQIDELQRLNLLQTEGINSYLTAGPLMEEPMHLLEARWNPERFLVQFNDQAMDAAESDSFNDQAMDATQSDSVSGSWPTPPPSSSGCLARTSCVVS